MKTITKFGLAGLVFLGTLLIAGGRELIKYTAVNATDRIFKDRYESPRVEDANDALADAYMKQSNR